VDLQRWWVTLIPYGQLHITSTKEITVGLKLKYVTPLLAAGAAAVVIAAAPTAFAADQQVCNGTGSGTVCLSPGNVSINASNHPSGDVPDLTTQGFALALGLAT
jgi:hypothetical protein